MPYLDLTVAIHCVVDNDSVNTITNELNELLEDLKLNELLEDLKYDFVMDGVTNTVIEINERVSKQHLLFTQKS